MHSPLLTQEQTGHYPLLFNKFTSFRFGTFFQQLINTKLVLQIRYLFINTSLIFQRKLGAKSTQKFPSNIFRKNVQGTSGYSKKCEVSLYMCISLSKFTILISLLISIMLISTRSKYPAWTKFSKLFRSGITYGKNRTKKNINPRQNLHRFLSLRFNIID